MGILLVTHHVSEIIPEIERVILLREGRILSDGSKSSVLNEEHLSDLFGVAARLAGATAISISIERKRDGGREAIGSTRSSQREADSA